MELRRLIEMLESLAAEHGDSIDVTLWQYSGGMDDLMNALPAYDKETQTLVIEAKGRHTSGAQR